MRQNIPVPGDAFIPNTGGILRLRVSSDLELVIMPYYTRVQPSSIESVMTYDRSERVLIGLPLRLR